MVLEHSKSNLAPSSCALRLFVMYSTHGYQLSSGNQLRRFCIPSRKCNYNINYESIKIYMSLCTHSFASLYMT